MYMRATLPVKSRLQMRQLYPAIPRCQLSGRRGYDHYDGIETITDAKAGDGRKHRIQPIS